MSQSVRAWARADDEELHVLRSSAREHARADWGNDGAPRDEWRALISEDGAPRRRGRTFLRYGLPNPAAALPLPMRAIAAIREHLAAKSKNDLQDEVATYRWQFPIIPAIRDQSSGRSAGDTSKASPHEQAGNICCSASPNPATAATRPGRDPKGVRDGDRWVIDGRKRWNSQVGRAQANLVFLAHRPASRARPRASPPLLFPPIRPATTCSTITKNF